MEYLGIKLVLLVHLFMTCGPRKGNKIGNISWEQKKFKEYLFLAWLSNF